MQQGAGFAVTGNSSRPESFSSSDNSAKHNHTGGGGDTTLRSSKRCSTSRQPIVHDEHFCAICSKPIKYLGVYTAHMKEQCHLRIFENPCGMGYICRFCPCSTFEDVNSIIRHLWDNHSLNVENLVFHEHCADCYWQKSFSMIDGPANAAFDVFQCSTEFEDSGGQQSISEHWDHASGQSERTGN
jgi:hypothetical protein